MSLELEWTDEQLEEAGLDKRKVLSIARRLSKLSEEMQALGLSVYGAGSGTGFLMHRSRPSHGDNATADRDSPIADVGTGFSGGDW